MAEALALMASIIAVLQLAGALVKLGSTYCGPSRFSLSEIQEVVCQIQEFESTLRSLQNIVSIDESDETRLETYKCLDAPLRDCHESLQYFESKLKNRIRDYLVGRLKDMETKKHRQRLKNANSLLQLVISSDQL